MLILRFMRNIDTFRAIELVQQSVKEFSAAEKRHGHAKGA